MSREDSIIADDSSSVGNKEDDDDDDEDGGDDDKFEGFTGDPERLKAFNVSDLCQGLIQNLISQRIAKNSIFTEKDYAQPH